MRTHIDLFSGIGGFTLTASWCGIKTVAFCEIDKRCRDFLGKAWPGIPCIPDIRDFTVDSFCQPLYNLLDEDTREEIDMAAEKKNYDSATELYEAGFSIQKVADYYEITRQAMWMILKRRGCQFRPHLKYGTDNHFFRGGSTWSDRATNLTEEAIHRGRLEVKPCEVCGENGKYENGIRKVQSHHDDYNFPLRVRWLCQIHHHEWHKNYRAIPRREVLPKDANCHSQITLMTAGVP
jgi:hypothetical protein